MPRSNDDASTRGVKDNTWSKCDICCSEYTKVMCNSTNYKNLVHMAFILCFHGKKYDLKPWIKPLSTSGGYMEISRGGERAWS
jgi:hypothetical protein